MADPCYIAQVSLQRHGGLPEDAVVNVMHFQADDTNSEASDQEDWDNRATGLVSRLVTFYQTIGTSYAATLTGAGTIKLYNHRDAKPRIPRVTQTFTFVPGGNALPAEVAMCLSFQATLESGVDMRRRRGRIFLGPFSTGVLSMPGDMRDVVPLPGTITAFLAAAQTMAHGTSGAARLAIYSPTTDAASDLDGAYNDAKTLWIDRAFDTQRRRGARASSREIITLSS